METEWEARDPSQIVCQFPELCPDFLVPGTKQFKTILKQFQGDV